MKLLEKDERVGWRGLNSHHLTWKLPEFTLKMTKKVGVINATSFNIWLDILLAKVVGLLVLGGHFPVLSFCIEGSILHV